VSLALFPPDPGFRHLPGFALPDQAALHAAITRIAATNPFRHMATPGGKMMSVAMTNCGTAGWVTDRRGYRYARADPLTGTAWPDMPEIFTTLATRAAASASFEHFTPDACLINRYTPGAKMALHQDRDEADFTAPIVSVSLGLPIIFLWGGAARTDKPQKIPLISGDVIVWGGPARLNFHGVGTLQAGVHPLFGNVRFNLTFRKAL